MKNETSLIEIKIENLIEADWNYKQSGDREKIDKLKASISFDKSVGVLAVREISENTFEVIDGNHRLVAIRELGWKTVPCENFGKISKAKAIIIARRRNAKWFEDDVLKLGKLYSEDVLSEFDVDFLESIGTDSKNDILNFSTLGKGDWTDAITETSEQTSAESITITLKVPLSVSELWEEWKKINKTSNPNLSEADLFEYAIAEALNGVDKND